MKEIKEETTNYNMDLLENNLTIYLTTYKFKLLIL
jgi:hypothetical protein